MELLHMARARDDVNLRWRIAAAMQLKAQAEAEWTLSPESTAMRDWVLDNPMEEVKSMTAFVVTNPTIAAAVVIADGAVDTSNVTDNDIKFVVGDKWIPAAKMAFPQN